MRRGEARRGEVRGQGEPRLQGEVGDGHLSRCVRDLTLLQ